MRDKVILGLVLGVIFAYVWRRNPLHILKLPFESPYVLIAGLLLQITLTVIAATNEWFPQWALVFSFLVVIIGLFLNRRFKGIKWIIVGTCLNTLVVALNSGLMPVSTSALDLAGLHSLIGHLVSNSRHRVVTDFTQSRLWWLGDWIPLLHQVASPGDILVGIGLFRFVFTNAGGKDQVS